MRSASALWAWTSESCRSLGEALRSSTSRAPASTVRRKTSRSNWLTRPTTVQRGLPRINAWIVVSERVSGSSTETITIAGSSVCAQVDATGPNPASPTTSSVPKLLSARRRPATASGCGSTIRILSGSATVSAPRPSLPGRHDPPSGDPALALIWQLHLEPVGALPDDLQLRTVFHLVEHACRDRRTTAHVGRVDGDDGQILRQRSHQCHAHALLDHRARLIDQRGPEVGRLEVLGDLD